MSKSIAFATKSRTAFAVLFVSFSICASAQSSGIWTGKPITFTKSNFAVWTDAANQDRITDSVWITRQDDKSLFNIRKNSSYGNGSPIGTQWSFGTTADLASLTFTDWITAVNNKPNSAVNKDMVLFIEHDSIYIDIKLTSFSGGGTGGGFEYIRSTDCRSFSSTDAKACISYSSPSGKTWTTSGIHYDTLSNDQGCDSIIQVDLTIISVNTDVVAKGDTILAQEVGATYQWLNCDNYNRIAGQTNAQFITTTSGNYAVDVMKEGCRDTSDCVRIQNSSIPVLTTNKISVYPNPSKGPLRIDAQGSMDLTIFNQFGQEVIRQGFTDSTSISLNTQGLYYLVLTSIETGAHKCVKVCID